MCLRHGRPKGAEETLFSSRFLKEEETVAAKPRKNYWNSTSRRSLPSRRSFKRVHRLLDWSDDEPKNADGDNSRNPSESEDGYVCSRRSLPSRRPFKRVRRSMDLSDDEHENKSGEEGENTSVSDDEHRGPGKGAKIAIIDNEEDDEREDLPIRLESDHHMLQSEPAIRQSTHGCLQKIETPSSISSANSVEANVFGYSVGNSTQDSDFSEQLTLDRIQRESQKAAEEQALRDKKEHILREATFGEMKRIRDFVLLQISLARGSRCETKCWLYKEWQDSPLLLKWRQCLVKKTLSTKKGNLCWQFGLWAHLLYELLTEEQKLGLMWGSLAPDGPDQNGSRPERIEKWDLSHLCGNWPCINPDHAFVEPHSINLSRQPCHKDPEKICGHNPRCIQGCTLPKEMFLSGNKSTTLPDSGLLSPDHGLLTPPSSQGSM